MALTKAPAELLNLDSSLTISGTTPSLTIGDAGAEDTKIVFDGNAQDYYVGLDDSADELIIGRGSTVGTTPVINISSGGTATFQHPIVLQSGATQGLYIENNAADATTPRITNDANDHTVIRPGKSGGAVQWNNFANDAELMRLDDSGNVSLPSQVATGTLPQGRLEVVAAASSNCINTQITTAGNYACFGASGPTTSGGNYYQYGRMINSSGSQAGTIVVNHSSVTYNTTSDYRLKENVTKLTNATTRLKQLQPKRFNFIEVPDITVDGFLAHQVSNVVPEAITGTKDEVDDDGNAVYQGIDQSKLVPLLVAAIQEQQTLIETLDAKVKALEEA